MESRLESLDSKLEISKFLENIRIRLNEVEVSIKSHVENDFEASQEIVSYKLRENAKRVVDRTFFVDFSTKKSLFLVYIRSQSLVEQENCEISYVYCTEKVSLSLSLSLSRSYVSRRFRRFFKKEEKKSLCESVFFSIYT